MIKLNASEEKEIKFDIDVSGVGVHELKGAIRLKIGNVEYGFTAYVIDHTIKVVIPPLDSFVKDELLNGQQVNAKLEIIADDTYLVPWEDTLEIETSAKIKVSKVEVGVDTNKTKVAVTKVQEEPIKLLIEKGVNKNPIPRDKEKDMSKKVIKYNTNKAEEVEDRVLRFVGSNEDIDRDQEVIKSSGWKLTNYKKNPIVLVNHNPFDLPVAKTKKVWVDKDTKSLMFDIEFPEPSVSSEGDTLYKLYKNGYMNATSVGFLPDFEKMEYGKKKTDPRVTFNGQELMELSLVSVPANPNALLTGKSIDKAIESKVVDELEMDELRMFLEKAFDEIENKSTPIDVDDINRIEKDKKALCKDCDVEIEPICNKCIEKIESEAFFKKAYSYILEVISTD